MSDLGPSPASGRRLDASNVLGYLVDRGIVPDETGWAEPLGGGVSAEVLMVRTPRASWVVKQALPRLRVAQEWTAAPTRIITEAAALRLAHEIVPDNVPGVELLDPDFLVVVMQRAPDRLVEWKSELMAGGTDKSAATATRLGEILARVHSHTCEVSTLQEAFGDTEAFVQLRIDPFYRTVAAKFPRFAAVLAELGADLLGQPTCLVHGDFSPKNMLADGGDLWVLDWEVAHLGNPVFDLAFMLAHLVCKSVHQPRFRVLYRTCARRFLAAYDRDAGDHLRPDEAALLAHTAAIVLARTDGKSPAPYLTAEQRQIARTAAGAWLADPSPSGDILNRLWSELP